MTDSPSHRRWQPVPDSTWRTRLVQMPRRAKQLLMLVTDAIGMSQEKPKDMEYSGRVETDASLEEITEKYSQCSSQLI